MYEDGADDCQLSELEIEALKEDELFLQIVFSDDRFVAAAARILQLQRELKAATMRIDSLMDEKSELVKHCKQLTRQLQRKLKPNTSTRERKDGRPF